MTTPQDPSVRVIAGTAATDNGDGTVTVQTPNGPIIAANPPAVIIIDDQAWTFAGASGGGSGGGGSGSGLPEWGNGSGMVSVTAAFQEGDIAVAWQVSTTNAAPGNMYAASPGWTDVTAISGFDGKSGMEVYVCTTPATNCTVQSTISTDLITARFWRTGKPHTRASGGASPPWPDANLIHNWTFGNTGGNWTALAAATDTPGELSGVTWGAVGPLGATGQGFFALMPGGQQTVTFSKPTTAMRVLANWGS